MVTIPLGIGDWESVSQNIPRLKLNNMYLTKNPASADEFSRVCRPSLTLQTTIGDGPFYGAYSEPGVFNGDWFVVSGTDLYRHTVSTGVTKLIGSIPGTGYCDMVGTIYSIMIVRDGVIYRVFDDLVTIIAMPDDKLVSSVASINGFYLFGVIDSQRYYWLEPASTVVNALHFASAERIPDNIVSINRVGDEIWFLGDKGAEVWTPTGDVDSPFIRTPGRVYQDGCHANETAVEATIKGLPSLIWVTDTKSVVISQGQPIKISNASIEEIFKSATNFRAWTFRHNRHDFYVVTCSTGTYVYDIDNGVWQNWESYEKTGWRAHLGFQDQDKTYAVDSIDGSVWKLEAGPTDNGEPILQEVAGFVPNYGKAYPCYSIDVTANIGWSSDYDVEPTLELRWSDNLGATWSNYTSVSLGLPGEYDRRLSYRSLGLISSPGRIVEFRFSSTEKLRIDYATLNEEV